MAPFYIHKSTDIIYHKDKIIAIKIDFLCKIEYNNSTDVVLSLTSYVLTVFQKSTNVLRRNNGSKQKKRA